MTWLRLTLGAVVFAAVAAGSVVAQTNAQRADALNTEGKTAMKAGNFSVASERFQQAILLSREGRFYFNLCVSLYSEGKFGDSLDACKAVESAGADAELKGKTAKMTGKVKEEMRKQGFDPDAPPVVTNPDPNNPDPNNPNNPDPNNPDPNNPNNPNNPDPNNPNNPNNPNPVIGHPPPAIGTPPTSLFSGAAPAHQYTWTLGAELLGGTTNFGGQDAYTAPMYGFRALGDYLFAPAKRIGAQATIGVMHTDTKEFESAGIDVIDIGIAGYKHFCGSGRVCFTPLIGASLGLLQPSDLPGSDALLAIGIRAEGRVGFALGQRFEHLLSISVGFQGYTRAFDSGDITAEDYALDGFSTAGVLALGYTYRFNTPFGSSPFVTLE